MLRRIALNALALRPDGSGVQTYIRELLQALPGATDADLRAVVQADAVDEVPQGVTAVPVPVARGARRALAGLRLRGDADLVHGLDVTLPLRCRVPTVATFHDTSFFDVPWAFRPSAARGRRLLARHAARTADALIAVSPFTAERVRELLGREAVVTMLAPPSDCVPPAPEAVAAVRLRFELPERFVLHVGTIEPRKDVAGLAEACARVGAPLVLAGAGAPDAAKLQARALGYVSRADLLALYGAATIVAYASRYEGFGLPAVEAAACGATVVVTDVASLRELFADSVGMVAPGDPDALASCLRELWNDADRRAELGAAGRARVAGLRWSDTARATAEVYRTLGIGEVRGLTSEV